jgi:hypothetical protein
VWQYTLNGTTAALEADGFATSRLACYVPALGPHIQIYSASYDPDLGWLRSMQFDVYDADVTVDFPLTPPTVGPDSNWPKNFSSWDYTTNAGFMAQLTTLYAGPQSKDDCKNGGWEKYGFKNQGQCVRYVETGMDSR